jgi:hypothetical protein
MNYIQILFFRLLLLHHYYNELPLISLTRTDNSLKIKIQGQDHDVDLFVGPLFPFFFFGSSRFKSRPTV